MKSFLQILLAIILCVSFGGVYAKQKKNHQTKHHDKEKSTKKNNIRYGIASFYGDKFHSRKTANGEVYQHDKFTAACNTLPLNTWVRVTNLKNNQSIIVKINDRLHSKNKRLIDLSKSAAQKLGYAASGVAKVKVEVLNQHHPRAESL